jgi:hypothetical protein
MTTLYGNSRVGGSSKFKVSKFKVQSWYHSVLNIELLNLDFWLSRMLWLWLIPVLVVIGLVLTVLAYRRVRVFGHHVQIERTQQLFLLQQDRLQTRFLQAAISTGIPAGFRWRSCSFNGDIIFARNRRTGELAAVIGIHAQFEPNRDQNGPLERQGSALFFFDRGHWRTVGKALFDRSPTQVLEQFKTQYQPLIRH